MKKTQTRNTRISCSPNSFHTHCIHTLRTDAQFFISVDVLLWALLRRIYAFLWFRHVRLCLVFLVTNVFLIQQTWLQCVYVCVYLGYCRIFVSSNSNHMESNWRCFRCLSIRNAQQPINHGTCDTHKHTHTHTHKSIDANHIPFAQTNAKQFITHTAWICFCHAIAINYHRLTIIHW